MVDGAAEAELHYRTFDASVRWDIGDSGNARLTLKAPPGRTVTTTLPIADEKWIRSSSVPFSSKKLNEFSPYNAGNRGSEVNAVVFQWQGELVVEFGPQPV
jgi:hypothetical protein